MTEGLMADRKRNSVLFLCTGNYYRSRLAEILFNSVAAKMGLSWQASSRALGLERGANNVGPMALTAVRALEARGILAADAVSRFPAQVTVDEIESADRVVAMKRAEHRPLLEANFSVWADIVEYWNVDDAPGALDVIEPEIMGLVARILGGGERQTGPTNAVSTHEQPATKDSLKKQITLKVGRETAGRRGKGVTTVFDMPFNDESVLDLAAKLKQRCGTGGTVKNGRIEIQGDQRERIVAELEKLGYKVKRAGG